LSLYPAHYRSRFCNNRHNPDLFRDNLAIGTPTFLRLQSDKK